MEERLRQEIDDLIKGFAEKEDIEKLEEFTKTRASEKTTNLFIGLVITMILLLLTAGGTNYMMYTSTNERVVKIETQVQNLNDRMKENNGLLKDIESLLRQHP